MRRSLVGLILFALIALFIRLPAGLASLVVLPLFWLIIILLLRGYIVFNPIIIGAIGLIAEGLGGLPLGNFSLLLLLTCWFVELIKIWLLKHPLFFQGVIIATISTVYSLSLYGLLALPTSLGRYLGWSLVVSLSCWWISNKMLQSKGHRW